MDILLAGEYKKQNLEHIPTICGIMSSDWALEFLQHADIMVESKAKISIWLR